MTQHSTSIVAYPAGVDGAAWLLAEETPVALVYNGQSYAVMMATPADLADFGLGFSLSEGIVRSAAEVEDIVIDRTEAGISVYLSVPPDCAEALNERRRALAGRAGCGLCGIEHLESAVRPPAPLTGVVAPASEAISRAFKTLSDHQPENARNHSVHAAGWVRMDGEIVLAREDVGRHNALDKLIGAMAAGGYDPAEGFVCLSSRCSVELIQKAAAFRIGSVVTLSAPTSLAVEMAARAGMMLATRGRGGAVVRFPS